MSGSLDGKLIVWDCWTGNKIQVLLRSVFVEMCKISNEMCKISNVSAGDPPEVGMGDDLSLLTEWQPGGLWWHGQHAYHVQHQQQV